MIKNALHPKDFFHTLSDSRIPHCSPWRSAKVRPGRIWMIIQPCLHFLAFLSHPESQSLGFGTWVPEWWEEPSSTGYDTLFFLAVIPLHTSTLLSILPFFTRFGLGPLRPPAGWGDSIPAFSRQRGQGLRVQTWHAFSLFSSLQMQMLIGKLLDLPKGVIKERWKAQMHGRCPGQVRGLSFAVTSYTNDSTLHSGSGD